MSHSTVSQPLSQLEPHLLDALEHVQFLAQQYKPTGYETGSKHWVVVDFLAKLPETLEEFPAFIRGFRVPFEEADYKPSPESAVAATLSSNGIKSRDFAKEPSPSAVKKEALHCTSSPSSELAPIAAILSIEPHDGRTDIFHEAPIGTMRFRKPAGDRRLTRDPGFRGTDFPEFVYLPNQGDLQSSHVVHTPSIIPGSVMLDYDIFDASNSDLRLLNRDEVITNRIYPVLMIPKGAQVDLPRDSAMVKEVETEFIANQKLPRENRKKWSRTMLPRHPVRGIDYPFPPANLDSTFTPLFGKRSPDEDTELPPVAKRLHLESSPTPSPSTPGSPSGKLVVFNGPAALNDDDEIKSLQTIPGPVVTVCLPTPPPSKPDAASSSTSLVSPGSSAGKKRARDDDDDDNEIVEVKRPKTESSRSTIAHPKSRRRSIRGDTGSS
ncbi:hypothetical protein C8J56DRAFT_1039467 [Mycena floridula]|nr:hypothetical protein C8J56DRAFT_1039467 [Mycena floridula]